MLRRQKFPEETCIVCYKVFEKHRRRTRTAAKHSTRRPINSITCSKKCSRIWNQNVGGIKNRRIKSHN